MKNSLLNVCKAVSLFALAAMLSACGGGGSSSTSSGGSGSAEVQGVATPSSVSVVTAQNAGN